MRILAIDTATENCSVALKFETDVYQLSELIPNGHSRRVHAMVRELLVAHNVELKDLDGLAVDIGPGSFTGVRIGIGIAQGLAFASGLQAAGVGSLAVLAFQQPDNVVLSAIDARMGQVYWCLFDTRDGVVPLMTPLVSNPQDVSAQISNCIAQRQLQDLKICGVGSGWQAYPDQLPTDIIKRPVEIILNRYPTADSVALLVTSGEMQSPALLSAAYVRNDVAKKAVAQ